MYVKCTACKAEFMLCINAGSKRELIDEGITPHLEMCPFCKTQIDCNILNVYWLDKPVTNKDVASLINRSSDASSTL